MSLLDAKNIQMMQTAAGRQASNRSGKSGPRLLDDAENNIGNSITLQPQVLPTGGPSYTVIPQSTANNSRLINLTSESKTGQSITAVVTAAKLANQKGKSGPVTMIAEFGNGSVTTQVEFDVPIGPFKSANLVGSDQNDQPQDSGSIIQLPTGILRLYARYDNAFVTPDVAGYAFGAPGSPAPILPTQGPFPPNDIPSPTLLKAFVAYFGRIHSRLFKTQYLFQGRTGLGGGPVTFGYVVGGTLFPGNYCVPPFARSVRVIRSPQSAAMTLQLLDLVNFSGETYAIPSGSPSPVIPIVGNETVVSLSSATVNPADAVLKVELVYEIGF
jgi:hypothetical protein